MSVLRTEDPSTSGGADWWETSNGYKFWTSIANLRAKELNQLTGAVTVFAHFKFFWRIPTTAIMEDRLSTTAASSYNTLLQEVKDQQHDLFRGYCDKLRGLGFET